MGRGRATEMPDEATLRRWFLEEGLSFQAMADRWLEERGIRASRAGMFERCKTFDWYVPRNMKHAGSNLLPWTDIRSEHTDAHDPSMLRKVHARRLGKVFDEKTDRDITAYEKGLIADGCVVHYDRNTIEGWHHVKKRKTDTDLVRLPKGYTPS